MLNSGFGAVAPMPSINGFKSKADALKYAIEFTASCDSSLNKFVNYDMAQELFDFICKNVQLPDVEKNETMDAMKTLIDTVILELGDK